MVARQLRTGDDGTRLRSGAPEETPSVLFDSGAPAPTGSPEDRVELGSVVPADRHPVEPLDVLEVPPGDLAERPAGVATEVEHAARRIAGRRPCRALRPPARASGSGRSPSRPSTGRSSSPGRLSAVGAGAASVGRTRPVRLHRSVHRTGGDRADPRPADPEVPTRRAGRMTGRRRRPSRRPRSPRALAVVRRAAGRVAQDVHRGIELDHPGGRRDPRRDIRVILASEPSVDDLDDLRVGLRVQLEDFVRIETGVRAGGSSDRLHPGLDRELRPARLHRVGSRRRSSRHHPAGRHHPPHRRVGRRT